MTDIGGLVRSVNPVDQGHSPLAEDELDALLVLINQRNDETDIEGLARRVEPMRPRGRGWLVAAAAAVVVVVVLAPLLLFTGGTERDVRGTEATVPVPPPGEGPKLEFVRVESPSYPALSLGRGGSVWFQGALYAIGDNRGELFRTVDGVTWELLPGFPAGDDVEELKTDGVRLVSATSAVKSIGVGFCWGSDAFFEVNTSTNGVDWTSSKIPVPVPEEAYVEGCFDADVGELAAGPQGIIVTGIRNDPKGSLFRDLAWYSPDGTTWQSLDAAGPLQTRSEAGLSAIVATLDGFVAASHGRLWESTDNGTTWTEGALLPARPSWLSEPLDVWAGTPISVSDQGVWTIEDTPQEVIPATGMNDMYHWVGDFGLFGLEKFLGEEEAADRGIPFREAVADEILFSEDGTTWNRWNPPELDPEAGLLWVVGIGDDFIVLQQQGRGLDNGVLWVGRLP